MEKDWTKATVLESDIIMDKTPHVWNIKNFKRYLTILKFGSSVRLSTTFEAGRSIGLTSTWRVTLNPVFVNVNNYTLQLRLELVGVPLEEMRQYFTKEHLFGVHSVDWKSQKGFENFRVNQAILNFSPNSNLPILQVELFEAPVSSKIDAILSALELASGVLSIPMELILFRSAPAKNLDQLRRVEQVEIANGISKLWPIDNPGQSTDVTICVKDDLGVHAIPAHRIILEARSPVFAAMFQTPMKETNTGIVEIEDVDRQAMEKLLEFIYTGQIRLDGGNGDIWSDVAYAAEKYQISGLLQQIDQILITVCKPENARTLLEVATKLNLYRAEVDIRQYISRQ